MCKDDQNFSLSTIELSSGGGTAHQASDLSSIT